MHLLFLVIVVIVGILGLIFSEGTVDAETGLTEDEEYYGKWFMYLIKGIIFVFAILVVTMFFV